MTDQYADLAKAYEDAKDAGTELKGLVPVKARKTRRAESVYSLRLTMAEMRVLSTAAANEGVKLSEFIRTAAMERAQGKEASSAIAPILEQLQELREANQAILTEIASIKAKQKRSA